MHYLSKMAIFGRSMLAVILIGLSISGCTNSPERLDPQFPRYRKPMGVMLVLVPEIGIFEQMPGGGQLVQDIQSHEAQRIAQQSIVAQLRQRHFQVQAADERMMQQPEIQSVTSLFRSVNRSIQLHTFGPQLFPAKLRAFEYNLGTVSDTLKANGADGLILTLGHQTGTDQPAKNWLAIAVVEPQGRIIWYGVRGDHQTYNLQRPESVTALVANTMANFWEPGS
jgi:hypothetical protein